MLHISLPELPGSAGNLQDGIAAGLGVVVGWAASLAAGLQLTLGLGPLASGLGAG